MQCIIMEKHCNQINTVIKLKSDLMNQFTIDMGVYVPGIHLILNCVKYVLPLKVLL